MENYYNTAYIIAGQHKDGRTVYYGYDCEQKHGDCLGDWFPSAVEDSNLYSSFEEAITALNYLADEGDKYPYIEYAWVEKLTTTPYGNTKTPLH